MSVVSDIMRHPVFRIVNNIILYWSLTWFLWNSCIDFSNSWAFCIPIAQNVRYLWNIYTHANERVSTASLDVDIVITFFLFIYSFWIKEKDQSWRSQLALNKHVKQQYNNNNNNNDNIWYEIIAYPRVPTIYCQSNTERTQNTFRMCRYLP